MFSTVKIFSFQITVICQIYTTITPPTALNSSATPPNLASAMGVGLGGSGHEQDTMEHDVATPSVGILSTPNIKEEAETSADSLTIDVEGHDPDDQPRLKTEVYSVENKAWIQALRTHVVVPLIRHPKSISFRKPVDSIALGMFFKSVQKIIKIFL